ncbi:hypothetical protein PS2_007398 [Malus domestica]
MQIFVKTLTGKTITPRFKTRKAFPQTSGGSSLLASSLKTAAHSLTTTSRRTPLFTWCFVSVVACKSLSRC